ncbi:hypothetical protein [Clostridium sp. BJN0013]|uniref:hypothetical protein n=1 Tax=Clostridium sp. BJN0013 TaxID=3236840 RepID=UPI0034C6D5F4
MNQFFSYPVNKDYLVKDICIQCLNRKATILCMNTIIDKEKIENHVILPLMYTRLEDSQSGMKVIVP